MTKLSDDLTTRFIAALQEHLAGGGEATLLRAYELGRQAIAEQRNALEMLTIQQEALVTVLLQHLRSEESTRIMRAASEIFTESLAPYELSRGSSQEGNALLQEVNTELERQITTHTAELIETNQALRYEITQRQRVEAALRLSEERFHNAFDHAPIGIALLAPNGQWLEVNHALCAMLGYSEEALLQTTFQAVTHPEDVAADQDNVQRLLAGAVSSYQWEKRYLHRQGHVIWVQVSVSLIRDMEQRPQHLIAQIQDITARKAAEAALRESQELFQTFMDNSPANAYIKDETGCYTYVNKPLTHYLQKMGRGAEWRNKTDADLWPAEASQIRANDQAVLAANTMMTLEETVTQEGNVHHWLSLKFPLHLPSGQRLLAGMSVDITERKRTQAWLESLIATTQDAVISIDRQRHIVRFNPAAEKMFGYRYDEVHGQKVNTLMAEPQAQEHDSYIDRYEQTRQPHVIGRVRTEAARRKNGEIFPVEISLIEITVDPDVRYVTFIRDISEKVRLQEQLLARERLAAVGTTAAKLVHEIGNPLNGMSVTTQMLQRRLEKHREALDAKILATVDSLRSEITRLGNLLQEFRSLSRQQQLTLRPTNLALVVQDVLSAESAHYTVCGIAIEPIISSDLPLVAADADKLKQVVLNLCKNAVEAMPDGGTLTVRVHNSQAQVHIEVGDTGVGIPAGVNVFEPFMTTKREGTGLGLPIVQQIVETHNGTLTYTSTPGCGTTFIVSLPISSGKSSPTWATVESWRVLIPGDNTTLRE